MLPTLNWLFLLRSVCHLLSSHEVMHRELSGFVVSFPLLLPGVLKAADGVALLRCYEHP